MKVHYEFARDGITGVRSFSDVEVSEELGAVLMELDREEYNSNQTETRRHASLSSKNDKWNTLVDTTVDVENEIICNFEYERLHKAMKQLLPMQQELLKKVFFDGVSMSEIARRENVDKSAVSHRFQTISKRIKKYL